jgi:hypothetical protein
MTLILSSAILAVVVWGCGVESPESPVVSSSPMFRSMGNGVGGFDSSMCAGYSPDECCWESNHFAICTDSDEVCKHGECVARAAPCSGDKDCIVDAGEDAGVPLFCGDAGICVAMGCVGNVDCHAGQQCIDNECFCTSNRGCEEDRVCDGENKLAVCVLPICEGELDAGVCDAAQAGQLNQGCSIARGGGSTGILFTAFSILTLAIVSTLRRRRSE